MPMAEVEVMLCRLSRLRSSCSSGAVMPCSTSSALAPLQTTRTVMMSRSKVGKNCVLSFDSAQLPARIISTMSRFAATRWRAKSRIRPWGLLLMVCRAARANLQAFNGIGQLGGDDDITRHDAGTAYQ